MVDFIHDNMRELVIAVKFDERRATCVLTLATVQKAKTAAKKQKTKKEGYFMQH